MSVIYHGESLVGKLVEDYPAEIVIDRFGVASASLRYTSMYENAVNLVLTQTEHPQFSFLKRKKAVIRREEAGWATITIDFEGVAATSVSLGGSGFGSTRNFSINSTVTTEPIETHPHFHSLVGTPEDPKNGAQFNSEGKFTGFSYTHEGERNKFAGLRSYLSPNIIFEETLVKGNINFGNILQNVGTIAQPPSEAPDLGGKRDWLFVGATVRNVGGGLELKRKFRSSGHNGWTQGIYRVEDVN